MYSEGARDFLKKTGRARQRGTERRKKEGREAGRER